MEDTKATEKNLALSILKLLWNEGWGREGYEWLETFAFARRLSGGLKNMRVVACRIRGWLYNAGVVA